MNVNDCPSEVVLAGHPDKLCDQISDRILDTVLEDDGDARVAVEAMIKDDRLFVAGEVSTIYGDGYDMDGAIRDAVGDVLIMSGLSGRRLLLETAVSKQSRQIGRVVDNGRAGDQCVVVGFASDSGDMLPKNHSTARCVADVVNRMVRHHPYLLPDGKVYCDNVTVAISVQHTGEEHGDTIRQLVENEVREKMPSIARGIIVNPVSDFVFGGSYADSGLTGRKIVVDAYGPSVPVGGGSFSGKDMTKVDRYGAYVCRLVAQWLVKDIKSYYSLSQSPPVIVRASYVFGDSKVRCLTAYSPIHTVGAHTIGTFLNKAVQDYRPMFNVDGDSLAGFMLGHNLWWSFWSLAQSGHFGRRDLNLPWETYE
jgi:S-adenosylmethionine synthetase